MWTDDRLATLKALFEEGLSASQMAAELGGVTRNAVLGKIHRLGWSRPTKVKVEKSPKRRRVPSPHGYKRKIRLLGTAFADLKAVVPPADSVVPLGISVLELRRTTCRWPYGGYSELIVFCGHPVQAGCPYCPSHAEVAYEKRGKSRRQAFYEAKRREQRQFKAEAVEESCDEVAA